jgi:hypothetical protein
VTARTIARHPARLLARLFCSLAAVSRRLISFHFNAHTGGGSPLDFERYVEHLYDEDELLALVMLNGGKGFGKTTVGFYRDRKAFYKDVSHLNGRGNLYINLNRLHPDVYGRAADRLRPYSETRFSAEEIIWRPRLCVDIDPVRISGINSTAAELQAAIDMGSMIHTYITENWDSDVLPIHSGNGVQLLLKIDEPPDSPLVSESLSVLDSMFSTPTVKVDTSLSDLARIVRIPGTLNCKGDDIPERPRRVSHIMEVANV